MKVIKAVCFGFRHDRGSRFAKAILCVASFSTPPTQTLNAIWRKIEFDPVTAAKADPITKEVSKAFNHWMKYEVAELIHHHWPVMKISDIHSLLAYNLQSFIASINE